MRIYLVRHGQTAWNVVHRAQGHANVPLDAVGERQAALLAGAMAKVRLSRILTSDLDRARQTAQAVAERHGLTWEERSALRERAFGEWEGLGFNQLRELLDSDFESTRPPGGENMKDVWERIRPVADEVAAETEPTLVVGHGASLAILLSQLIGGSYRTARAFRFENVGITELARRSEGPFRIVRLNDVAHLTAEVALERG